jgi:hypothetical protein
LGAPKAQQVLDRWLGRLHARLAARLTASQMTSPLTPPIEARALRRSTADPIARQARRRRRFACDEPVRALYAQHCATRQRARQLRMSRTTVIRYLRTEAFPERAQSRRVSMLDPYVTSLHTRWEAGCHHGVHLWREIQALGFPGTRRLVSNWVVLRRELELGRPSADGRRPALPKAPVVRLLPAPAAGVGHPLPAPRQLVWGL